MFPRDCTRLQSLHSHSMFVEIVKHVLWKLKSFNLVLTSLGNAMFISPCPFRTVTVCHIETCIIMTSHIRTWAHQYNPGIRSFKLFRICGGLEWQWHALQSWYSACRGPKCFVSWGPRSYGGWIGAFEIKLPKFLGRNERYTWSILKLPLGLRLFWMLESHSRVGASRLTVRRPFMRSSNPSLCRSGRYSSLPRTPSSASAWGPQRSVVRIPGSSPRHTEGKFPRIGQTRCWQGSLWVPMKRMRYLICAN